MKNNFKKSKLIKWYAINIYSGYEKYVQYTLIQRIKEKNLQKYFKKIIIPNPKEIKIVENKSLCTKKMPGYLLIKCHLTEKAWEVVQSTPKIIGFVGNIKNPIYLKREDIRNIYILMKQKNASISSTFQLGTFVKITHGPFANLHGIIKKINTDKKILQVMVSFLGRLTPIEISFSYADKIS